MNTLDIQVSISKTKSLDYLAMDDEFDMEFQKLAEARSNPHLLDIGELSRNDVKGEVKQYMLGDRSADDLARPSHMMICYSFDHTYYCLLYTSDAADE